MNDELNELADQLEQNDQNLQPEKKDIFDKLMHLPVLNIFEPFYKKYKEEFADEFDEKRLKRVIPFIY